MTATGWKGDIDRFMRLCDMDPMNDRLFMLLMEGVAGSAPAYRPGARHALMIFATGPDLDAAQSKALEFVSSKGWTLVEPRRAKEVGGDIETIADDTLRSAAETALARGSALIIYQDEIRPDASGPLLMSWTALHPAG